MSVLFERLRAALGGDYELIEEVASGGMGVVFRARDRALGRVVAIKTIRPELATADLIVRFLREARLLASFRHPNIVPIHRAGEADGLPYYVMDFLEGETLAGRLQRGPIAADEVLRIADDLLAALEAVHAHGIVHRDIKPANVLLVGGRAVIGDFGVSKTPALSGDTTAPGHLVGTPKYMAPEQLALGDVTPRTDVCAAAMVLFEAFTGRAWTFETPADQVDWSGVPASVVPALRRALARSPAERWPTVEAFRTVATGAAPVRPGIRRLPARAAIGAAALAVVVIGWILLRPWSRATGAPVKVEVRRFTAPPGQEPLGDSVTEALAAALRSAPDVDFRREGTVRWTPDLVLGGRVSAQPSGLEVAVSLAGAAAPFDTTASGGLHGVTESLAGTLLLKVWAWHDRRFGRDLPAKALPVSARGLSAWARAEALYAQARWSAADSAYAQAIELDSTCALCRLRLSLIRRWLQRDEDSVATLWLLDHRAAFTPPYRRLIDAGVDREHRLDLLERLVSESPDFDLGLFVYADELFHRGPLSGHARAEALTEFRRLVLLRPQFGPGWEHLTWIAIGEGDTATASEALERYQRTADMTDATSTMLHALLTAAYAWRFRPAAEAERTTAAILGSPAVGSYPGLGIGAQHLAVFDAPEGALYVGRRLSQWRSRPDLIAPGRALAVAAFLAGGRTDSALAEAARLAAVPGEADAALTAAEFHAALLIADSTDARASWPHLESALGPLTREGASSSGQRRRSAWMLALLAPRAGELEAGHRYRALLATDPDAFDALLAADSAAATSPAGALALSQPLLALDSAGRAGDPFFRAMLHLLRSRWRLAEHNPAAAANELLWSQNTDFVGRPMTVQAAEVDWALGTVARWRRARILDPEPGACRPYADVARLWAGGDARSAARADTARGRFAQLNCSAAP